MLRSILFCLLCFCLSTVVGQNAVPEISNLRVTISGPEEMTIEYDLDDAENDEVEISLRVSDNDGETYDVNTMDAMGDIGFPTSPGSGKTITWNFDGQISMSGDYTVMLVADDRETIDIQAIVDQVDSILLRQDLEFIEGIRHRTAGPAHLQEVKDLIIDRFETANLDTEIMSWPTGNYRAENIIGRKAGLTDDAELYIIDGHFDSVDESPGADDNGSAVAGMLEALRVLEPYQFEKSIKFIGFDLEEAGLVGSRRYVNQGGLKSYERVGGVFNLEMIGYYDNSPNSQTFPTGFNLLYPDVYNDIREDSFRGNFITNVGIHSHPDLNQDYEDAAATYVPGLKVVSILAPEQWTLLTPDLGRSDHAPFWLQDMPALMLTDGSNFRNPYYHTPNDTVGTLNFTFMSQVVKATVAAVAELAGVTHSSYATTEVEVLTNADDLTRCTISTFPNPNSNFINLEMHNCLTQDVQLDIFDINGTLKFSGQIETDSPSLRVQTSSWSSGTYLLILRNENQSVQHRVVVSQ